MMQEANVTLYAHFILLTIKMQYTKSNCLSVLNVTNESMSMTSHLCKFNVRQCFCAPTSKNYDIQRGYFCHTSF